MNCSECGKKLTEEEIKNNIRIGEKVSPQCNYCRTCWYDYCEHAITGD
jgi:hypothetical protein